MRSLRKHMSQCVVCGEPPYRNLDTEGGFLGGEIAEQFRNLGLVGPTCRSCLTKALESDDYMEWYEKRL